MSFGAMLTDENGVPFYIDGTQPLTLTEKRVLSVAGTVNTQTLFANDGAVRFVFVNSNGPQGIGSTTCESLIMTNGSWVLQCSGPARTVNVYIFGYQYQPVPGWGIAIYDSSGNCILTNETKVLRDVQAIGDITDINNSGNNIDITKSGTWAVAPTMTGYFHGVNSSTGQPVSVNAAYYSSARYDGTTTEITSGYIGNVDGTAANATWVNYRNTITAIDVSNY